MKAGVLHAREDIRYEEVETPVPKAGEVLVKVKYSGICGSDVPRVNGDGAHFYPIILGHEFSGVVEEVGEGVTKVKKGQRVAGAPLVPCMKCEDCMKGDYALCKHYSFIGTRQPGSFAEYIVFQNRMRFHLMTVCHSNREHYSSRQQLHYMDLSACHMKVVRR